MNCLWVPMSSVEPVILASQPEGPGPPGLGWAGRVGPPPSQVAGVGVGADSEYMAPSVQLPLPGCSKAWEQWLPFWGSQGTWPDYALSGTVSSSASPGPPLNLEKAPGYWCCSWRTTGPLSKQGGECAPGLGLFVLASPGGGLAQLGC